MAQGQRLELKMYQKLILTPQLQQSIKLLQLPLLELSQNITQELMENPMLEEVMEREPESRNEVAEAEAGEEAYEERSDDAEAPLEKIFGFTTDDYFEERASDGRDLGYFNDGSEVFSPFERNTRRPDLYEHLLWQLRLSRIPGPSASVIEIVISNLDDDGYLQASLDEIAAIAKADLKAVEEALSLLQEFDPPGVGARNLQECLLLQMKALKLDDSLVEKILRDGFDLLEKNKYKQLASRLKTSIEDILKAVTVIKGFEPKPGRSYSSEEALHIIPDVYIEESDGKFIILLNDEGIPRLRLSNYYRKLLANKKALGAEERNFLEDKLRSAVWLLKSLDQRNKTIYRVAESILKFQEEFFRRGLEYLKPLNLKNVADDLDMHESTISRVTSNKYLQCPQGLLSFRFFFSNMVPSAEGSISSTIVKNVMKEIISKENPKDPFSDQKIVELLNGRSINITRRTVAKYREGLKIPSHFKRKEWD
jgi:RNA polymerase sigma-54 factor